MVEDDGARIDAEAVVNRGEELAGWTGSDNGGDPGFVGLTVDMPAAVPPPGENGGVAVRPVVTARKSRPLVPLPVLDALCGLRPNSSPTATTSVSFKAAAQIHVNQEAGEPPDRALDPICRASGW